MHELLYNSPIGPLLIKGSKAGIRSLQFHSGSTVAGEATHKLPVCLQVAAEQLTEYFCHLRENFDLPLDLQGTPFQLTVWKALLAIPPGATLSYAQLAERVGAPGAARAVGMANAHNPCLILLPCHRVIGSNGVLTGYAGGLLRKQWLLQHEQQVVQLSLFY
jgi:methylated-DNA-[protein]-cysteine S-methyltransferase